MDSSAPTGVTPNPIPATFLRGGTSKGLFLLASHLPQHQSLWKPIFLALMGSPDSSGSQLNGMGGGSSSTSKVVVVGPPAPARRHLCDVEYTFAQIAVRTDTVDYGGNCGNLSSMVGVFALDQGICTPKTAVSSGVAQTTSLVLYNTNTDKFIRVTFPMTLDGQHADLHLPQISISGVPGILSRIILEFLSPSGARTGKLLPTGNHVDSVRMPFQPDSDIRLTLMDATNPCVFVDLESLSPSLCHTPPETSALDVDLSEPTLISNLERLRRRGAELMGLDPSVPSQPKIALLSRPSPDDPSADIVVQTVSMGVGHKTIPMTVALCIGVGAFVRGTIPSLLVGKTVQGPSSEPTSAVHWLRIRHPGGVVDVGAEFDADGGVKSAQVARTGRRLMRGEVWW